MFKQLIVFLSLQAGLGICSFKIDNINNLNKISLSEKKGFYLSNNKIQHIRPDIGVVFSFQQSVPKEVKISALKSINIWNNVFKKLGNNNVFKNTSINTLTKINESNPLSPTKLLFYVNNKIKSLASVEMTTDKKTNQVIKCNISVNKKKINDLSDFHYAKLKNSSSRLSTLSQNEHQLYAFVAVISHEIGNCIGISDNYASDRYNLLNLADFDTLLDYNNINKHIEIISENRIGLLEEKLISWAYYNKNKNPYSGSNSAPFVGEKLKYISQ